ncbi:sn-glycerol-3-phosphate ABC transporter ATP-binding protein UgpC [Micromonospora polyrhachis]|uniref:Multiple sugar transport system ATP-binding protein n=1 Tax=Micromonospora polyrhachis TaxID=1282883 RepID=A0A7W7SSJ0_9ACTN|nr:ABC transporter ATP-binding protein [Micromonospora polyrhachis]MBB4960159.1 multiple sugar transport system ATP-binding protein [Micromonospora polyrhachis]
MVAISIDRLTKSFGDVVAVDGVSIEVRPGEVLALLGPTGCGKSTLLRLVAGLDQPSGGQVRIDGRPVDQTVARERRVALVFPEQGLYPHLTVEQNIAFPLRAEADPTVDVPARVAEVAEQLGVTDLLRRRPDHLSGGERQRVAIARAIIRRPYVLLLDEPLSNLEAGVRAELRTEVAALARRLAVTTLYVTHDQVEAMTVADRVAVLRRGVLQQVGPPAQIYADPDTLFVAAFVGTPRASLVQAAIVVEGDRVVVDFGTQTLEFARDDPRFASLVTRHTERVTVALRPEALTPVAADTEPEGRPVLRGRVRLVENLGHEAVVHVATGAVPTSVAESRLELPDVGRHLADLLTDSSSSAASHRPDGLPATARTEYGFYPVYDPELPGDPPPAGDVVIRVPAPVLPRVGEALTLAVDPDRLLFFDRAGDRIRLG